MEGQRTQGGKLTRNPSSLRSPTMRPSSLTLSALDVENPDEKKHLRPPPPSPRASPPLLPILLSALFFLPLLLAYLKASAPTRRNLLLASAGVAIVSVLAKRSRLRRLGRRLRKSESVRWFIGDEERGAKHSPRRGAGGRIVREGVEFYSNGDVYEGEFHKGRSNGSGVYNFFGMGRYEGDWVDGKYDGYGVESWARGSRYRGQFRQGLRHGYGVYRFHNGDGYSGEWLGGHSHGAGVQTCSDGSSYAGEFKCGVKHGLGRYHFRNGDKYSGEYFGDKIHGFGVYQFANGHCYEGSWHEGRRQGFGTYTFRNGEAKSGEWDRSILKASLRTSDLSVARAVQAARKAAETASLLPSMEEQASKAIAGANRAATAARVAAIKAVQNHMDGKFCGITTTAQG